MNVSKNKKYGVIFKSQTKGGGKGFFFFYSIVSQTCMPHALKQCLVTVL